MPTRILLWNPRFPDRPPARLTVNDVIASAMARAGVAAAADPAGQGALLVGGALSSASPTPVTLQHGLAEQRMSSVTLPLAVAAIAIGLGLAAAAPGALVTPVTPPSVLSTGAWDDTAAWDDSQTWKDS